MIHSVPQFPNVSKTFYTYPNYGGPKKYGQNFFCLTLNNINQINTISKQLRYDIPWIWGSNVNLTYINTISKLDNLYSLLESQWLNGTSIVDISGGVNINSNENENDNDNFVHLTRSPSENLDIFEDIISDYYHLSFKWQTYHVWPSREESYCIPEYTYNEENILEMEFGNGDLLNYTLDHSKYGVSIRYNTLSDDTIVCVGDMDRVTTENTIGGGFLCFENENMYNVLVNTIAKVEECETIIVSDTINLKFECVVFLLFVLMSLFFYNYYC